MVLRARVVKIISSVIFILLGAIIFCQVSYYLRDRSGKAAKVKELL